MTPKRERFCQQFVVDLNATAAYQRTYPDASPKSARTNGARLLANAGIQARIAELQRELSVRTQITQEQVLERFWMIATANPNELVEFRRTCCRYCYGEGHKYQQTQGECAGSEERGGAGFDARKPPNPTCPECHGEGVGEVFFKDTRRLSPEALCLYAGTKVTKDGIEVKVHDQQAALVSVGRHLGMFKDVLEARVTTIDQVLEELDRQPDDRE